MKTQPKPAAHTPEPWEFYPFSGEKDGQGYATHYDRSTSTRTEPIHAERAEDAKRAVECVNALQGIAHPAEVIQAARAGLEQLLSRFEEERGSINHMSEVRTARAALALLTKEQS